MTQNPSSLLYGGRSSLSPSHFSRSQVRSIYPAAGTNLESDKVIEFNLRTHPDEMVSFGEKCLFVAYRVEYKNKDFAAGSPESAANPKWKTAQARTEKTYFIDPTLEAHAFISHITVTIGNVLVPNHLHSTSGALYHTLTKKFPGSPEVASCMTSLSYTDDKNKDYLQARTPLHFETDEEYTSVVTTPSGVFPFQPTCPTLDSVLGRPTKHVLLPPSTDIVIRLHLRDPIDAFIYRGATSVSGYFNEAAAASMEPSQFVYKFRDIHFNIDCYYLKTSRLARLRNDLKTGVLRYNYDSVRVQVANLVPSVQKTSQCFKLEKGAQLCYIFFMPLWGSVYMKQKNKPLTTMMRFPQNMVSIGATYGSSESLILEGDFKRLTRENFDDRSAMWTWYQYLTRRKLANFPFEWLFPRAFNGLSLCQAFVLDLTKENPADMLATGDQSIPLTLHTEFSEAKSPQSMQVFAISVHDTGVAKFTGKGQWSFSG